MRRFNVTGTCVGTEHYMVDISAELDEIEKLVEMKDYFTINRARQYRKARKAAVFIVPEAAAQWAGKLLHRKPVHGFDANGHCCGFRRPADYC